MVFLLEVSGFNGNDDRQSIAPNPAATDQTVADQTVADNAIRSL